MSQEIRHFPLFHLMISFLAGRQLAAASRRQRMSPPCCHMLTKSEKDRKEFNRHTAMYNRHTKSTDLAAPAEMVTGLVNGMINMPCRYTNQGSEYTMCWGRGGCPIYRCTDEIIRTNGKEVTWRKFNRYQLLGNIIDGDVSLTIIRVTKQDEGTYCCRVEVKGLFNDQKKELELKVEEENPVNANHHPTPTEQDSFSMLEECPDDTT